MKSYWIVAGALALTLSGSAGYAAMESGESGHMMHHGGMHSAMDDRVSLQLPPGMKYEQLANMRSHVKAIQTITGLVAAGDFDRASRVAHLKLGMTEEMRRMCNSFGNESFRKLGLAFHESGDVLGEVLRTRDVNKSLKALETTMGYCVQCHATFRQ